MAINLQRDYYAGQEADAMEWTKSPQGLIDLFTECLPDDARLERRKMFGYPAVFVHGNMCTGLFQDRVFARLSDADKAALPGGGAYFEPMPGRPMKAYAVIPDEVVADETALAEVLAKAVALTAGLPAKERKSARKK
jgi:TfoX/Sxy family transcriptional regulator of competence genes